MKVRNYTKFIARKMTKRDKTDNIIERKVTYFDRYRINGSPDFEAALFEHHDGRVVDARSFRKYEHR